MQVRLLALLLIAATLWSLSAIQDLIYSAPLPQVAIETSAPPATVTSEEPRRSSFDRVWTAQAEFPADYPDILYDATIPPEPQARSQDPGPEVLADRLAPYLDGWRRPPRHDFVS